MTDYIAELDEHREIAAVWVTEPDTRAPRVFDPRRHVFDPGRSIGFFGAPREAIEAWIRDATRALDRQA